MRHLAAVCIDPGGDATRQPAAVSMDARGVYRSPLVNTAPDTRTGRPSIDPLSAYSRPAISAE